MKVFKFGGGSVNSSSSIKKLAEILRSHEGDHLTVVISALGKTTNALEKLASAFYYEPEKIDENYNQIKDYHLSMTSELFPKGHNIFHKLNNTFSKLETHLGLAKEQKTSFDFEYDQIVSYGELLSTMIISSYLDETGLENKWFDARDILFTDNTYREGKVDWERSMKNISESLLPYFVGKPEGAIAVTQGFIGRSADKFMITLGREGSDYTAAIFAYALNATEVTIWKDVPGLLNADPKYFDETLILEQISYSEAIELAYYGATIIHPKTIKPLQNKHIPLYVKSFQNPDAHGSVIFADTKADSVKASYIFKTEQILISLSPHDFSFIAEENISYIFQKLAAYKIKVNLMQNSAISFSICVDDNVQVVNRFIRDLHKNFSVKYNRNLDLITIRHFNQETIDKVVGDSKILLVQKSRSTVQLVLEGFKKSPYYS